MFLLQICWQK